MDIEEITIEDEYDVGSDDGVNHFDFLNNSTTIQPNSRKNLIDQIYNNSNKIKFNKFHLCFIPSHFMRIKENNIEHFFHLFKIETN